jgi:hypothetical protein
MGRGNGREQQESVNHFILRVVAHDFKFDGLIIEATARLTRDL